MQFIILLVVIFIVVFYIWFSIREKKSINYHKKNQQYQTKKEKQDD